MPLMRDKNPNTGTCVLYPKETIGIGANRLKIDFTIILTLPRTNLCSLDRFASVCVQYKTFQIPRTSQRTHDQRQVAYPET